jgi:hypothetical protein
VKDTTAGFIRLETGYILDDSIQRQNTLLLMASSGTVEWCQRMSELRFKVNIVHVGALTNARQLRNLASTVT